MNLSAAHYSQLCTELLNQIECGVLIAQYTDQQSLGPFVEANEFICQRLGYSHDVFLSNNISLFSHMALVNYPVLSATFKIIKVN